MFYCIRCDENPRKSEGFAEADGKRIKGKMMHDVRFGFRITLVFLERKNRDSNKEGAKRKKTIRWRVFADVGNERSEAIGARRAEKIPIPH